MSPIACAAGVELLMDYLEGVVSLEVRTTLEAHVSNCAKCRAFIASYQETPRIVRDATKTTMPPEVAASLTSFIREQCSRKKKDS
jgi:predicted anti-sigma-YlaC factor YlaD